MSETGQTGSPGEEEGTDVGQLARRSLAAVGSQVSAGVERVTEELGGRARRRVVVLLACILSLDAADQGAIGAVAPQLERSLHVSNVELGLLVTVTALLGGIATIPMGHLVDHINRVRLVAIVVLCWGVAEAVSGISVDYTMLILTRLGLAAGTAVAAPAVASLTGDLFPPEERGRIYGFIITGELIGAGFGVLVSGLVAGWFGWRPALALLALPSLALSYALWRYLPEPARGGRSWIFRGAEQIPAAEETDEESLQDRQHEPARDRTTSDRPAAQPGVLDVVEDLGIGPDQEIVINEDPRSWGLWRAVRYVLSVKTNVIMIVSTSVGYFFFAGLKVFVVLFVRGQYGISQSLASVLVVVVGGGAVAGVVVAGRRSDRWIGKGRVSARVDVGIIGYLAASLLLVPALITRNLALALPFIIVAAAALAAPNGAIDAARLDVVPSVLWGRAEAVRTVVRTFFEAIAPLAFGFLSEVFGSNRAGFGTVASGSKSAPGSAAQVHGLDEAFLLMLVPLALSGLILVLGRRSYPVDVASAAESERHLERQEAA